MREYRLALATAGATFLLLVIGGLVHATGSSLACPDWPLCYGQFFPRMEGGILYEHGHRLAALAVVLLVAAVGTLVLRRRSEPGVRRLAVLAVALVVAQALLGGITVLLKLPLLVSSSHLAVSMAFFATVLVLANRLRPIELPRAPAAGRGLAAAAALATYLQVVLGALVRHTGAGLACNTGIPLCNDRLWPAGGPAQLQVAHRLLGALLLLLLLGVAWRTGRAALAGGHRLRAALALAAPLLAAAQIVLGFWTVTSFIAVPVVTLHLAGGALLLADLVALALVLGGQPRAAAAPPSAPSLVAAAG